MITHKQLTLAEVFEDCQNKFNNDKYQFLSLLDEAIPPLHFVQDSCGNLFNFHIKFLQKNAIPPLFYGEMTFSVYLCSSSRYLFLH